MYKKKIELSNKTHSLKTYLRYNGINTVCESARCPNISDCFSKGHLTFLILGPGCTRSCAFCGVIKGSPGPVDEDEPYKILKVVKEIGLKRCVITSVTRDDLPDFGANHFIRCVEVLKNENKDIVVELLTPDFSGDERLITAVSNSGADILSHNVETVPRLYSVVRTGGDYKRSITVLKLFKKNTNGKNTSIKSGVMVGLGEERDEVFNLIDDLKASGCDTITIGQYLQPSRSAVPVKKYISQKTFEEFAIYGEKKGLRIISGPFIRSSYYV